MTIDEASLPLRVSLLLLSARPGEEACYCSLGSSKSASPLSSEIKSPSTSHLKALRTSALGVRIDHLASFKIECFLFRHQFQMLFVDNFLIEQTSSMPSKSRHPLTDLDLKGVNAQSRQVRFVSVMSPLSTCSLHPKKA